jgi:hypothetical protein
MEMGPIHGLMDTYRLPRDAQALDRRGRIEDGRVLRGSHASVPVTSLILMWGRKSSHVHFNFLFVSISRSYRSENRNPSDPNATLRIGDMYTPSPSCSAANPRSGSPCRRSRTPRYRRLHLSCRHKLFRKYPQPQGNTPLITTGLWGVSFRFAVTTRPAITRFASQNLRRFPQSAVSKPFTRTLSSASHQSFASQPELAAAGAHALHEMS